MTIDEIPAEAKRFKTDWSVTDDEWLWLFNTSENLKVIRVLEFGPGYSTFAFPRVALWSVESSVASFEKLCADSNFPIRSGLRLWNRNPFTPERLPDFLDLGFVDGPPGHLHYYSRLGPMLYCFDNCCYTILHDTNRDGEKRTLEIVKNLGAVEIDRFDQDKGMVLLENKP